MFYVGARPCYALRMAYIPNRPGEDEFDRMYREWYVFPGFMLWAAGLVRGYRWCKSRLTVPPRP